jgi:hypothetical protein
MPEHTSSKRGKENPPNTPQSAEARFHKNSERELTINSPDWTFAAMPVSRSPLSIQPKLEIGEVDDPREREADGAADRVLRMPDPGATTQPKRAAGDSSGTDELLHSTGQPLDSTTRGFMEPRFGHDFSRVKVHADSSAAESAKSVNALAYTVGRNLVFGEGRYAPSTNEGTRLLAHELAHVVQNEGAGRSTGKQLLSRQTFGTAKTTAPPAKNESPGDVFREKLKDEVHVFANAGVILDWIVSQRTLAGGATVTSFQATSLFSDAATMKLIKPAPKSAADLQPALEMLEYYGVITSQGPGSWNIVLAPLKPGQTQQDVNRANFDKNRTDIAAFQKQFETRFDTAGHPIKPIAMQQLLDDKLAGGSKQEKDDEKAAGTNLAAVKGELDEFVAFRKKGRPIFRVATDTPAKIPKGTKTVVQLPVAGSTKPVEVDDADFDRIEPIRTGASPEVVARRTSIEARVTRAEQTLFNAQGFHRFANEMVWFLGQLNTASAIKFAAGTYPRHGKFGEYAADMFPVINEDTRGFYEVVNAEKFVDAINTVAEAGHPNWGKFAWQIVYNDTVLQTTINAKYGARMSSAPHHGPSPDKLHMHLDIRPLDVVADSVTGYRVDTNDRVALY